jgi:hypothetical protein
LTRVRAHPVGVQDAPTPPLVKYGRSGAWARIAQADAQRLLDAIQAAACEPQPPVLRLAEAADDQDGDQA